MPGQNDRLLVLNQALTNVLHDDAGGGYIPRTALTLQRPIRAATASATPSSVTFRLEPGAIPR